MRFRRRKEASSLDAGAFYVYKPSRTLGIPEIAHCLDHGFRSSPNFTKKLDVNEIYKFSSWSQGCSEGPRHRWHSLVTSNIPNLGITYPSNSLNRSVNSS